MTYATHDDMDVRFGETEIGNLGDADRIASALDDAGAEIDAALSGLYTLPLGLGPWPLLRSLECDLARFLLYDNSVPEAVVERAKAAREVLKGIREGEIALVDAGGEALARTTAARYKGPEPVMTADNLKGFTL